MGAPPIIGPTPGRGAPFMPMGTAMLPPGMLMGPPGCMPPKGAPPLRNPPVSRYGWVSLLGDMHASGPMGDHGIYHLGPIQEFHTVLEDCLAGLTGSFAGARK